MIAFCRFYLFLLFAVLCSLPVADAAPRTPQERSARKSAAVTVSPAPHGEKTARPAVKADPDDEEDDEEEAAPPAAVRIVPSSYNGNAARKKTVQAGDEDEAESDFAGKPAKSDDEFTPVRRRPAGAVVVKDADEEVDEVDDEDDDFESGFGLGYYRESSAVPAGEATEWRGKMTRPAYAATLKRSADLKNTIREHFAVHPAAATLTKENELILKLPQSEHRLMTKRWAFLEKEIRDGAELLQWMETLVKESKKVKKTPIGAYADFKKAMQKAHAPAGECYDCTAFSVAQERQFLKLLTQLGEESCRLYNLNPNRQCIESELNEALCYLLNSIICKPAMGKKMEKAWSHLIGKCKTEEESDLLSCFTFDQLYFSAEDYISRKNQ